MGGSDQEWNEAVIKQTADGGYILGAYTNSTDGDVECTGQELSTIWITKLEEHGNVQWNSCFGGSDQDRFSDLLCLPDGYLILGSTHSTDGEGLGNHGMQDALLIRIDLDGNKLWSRCYGGSNTDLGHGLSETTDGNFVFTAITRSVDGDLSGQNPYNPVAATGTTGWLVKVDGDGNVLWQRCIGGFGNDVLISLKESSDGSFIAVGNSSSIDGDIPQNRGGADAWVVKVDGAGDLVHSKTFGGSGTDIFYDCIVRSNGSVLAVGYTGSVDGNIAGPLGLADGWAVLLSEELELIWTQNLGGSLIDQMEGVCVTADDAVAMVGYSVSLDGDLTGNNGESDVWVVLLGPWDEPPVYDINRTAFTLFPNPVSEMLTIELGELAGPGWQLTIIDALGRSVFSDVLEAQRTVRMPVDHLKTGTYCVLLRRSDEVHVRRFIKIH